MVNNSPQRAPGEESGHPGFSRLSILRTLWKRRVRIALAWGLFAIVAGAVVHSLPSIYLAEAVVLIDAQKIPEKFVSATVASDLEERIIALRQQLLSGGALKKVIDEFGLYREERKNHVEEEILDMMRTDISITVDTGGLTGNSNSKNKRPGAFRIGYQGADPALVTRVANRLTDFYVEQNLKTREGQASGTSEFLETQLREAKKRLDEMEATVSKYKLEHNGELPQQEHSLSSALSRLQTELEANRDAVNRAQQTRVIVESNLNAVEANLSTQLRSWQQAQQRTTDTGDSSSVLSDNPVVAPQKKTSAALQDQLAILRGRYGEEHPDVARTRTELENVLRVEGERQAENVAVPAETGKARAGSRRVTASPSALREPPEFARSREQMAGFRAQILGLDQELETRKGEQQRILREIDSYQRRVEHLPIREQEMAQITRDYEMSKENYKSLLDKKMAAEMSLDMERRQQSERFVVLDRAQVPEKPIKPKRPLLYAGGVAASLILAIVLGFAAELKRNVFLGEWELPPGTTVLARLPHIEVQAPAGEGAPKAQGWFSRKPLATVSVALILVAAAAATGLYVFANRP